ncbi:MAG: hypothetical protein ACAI35_07555 [Candidatus Methylacidiphilales bacterium]
MHITSLVWENVSIKIFEMKALHMTMLLLAISLSPALLLAQTMPIDLGAPSALKDFDQLDMKTLYSGTPVSVDVLDVVAADGPAKGAVALKSGARPVSVLYKPLTISPKTDKKWTISLDFQKGPLSSGESLPAIGFTTDAGGVLASGSKSHPGFLLRIKSIVAERVRFDYATITPETKFELSPEFRLPADGTNWYRLSVTFEAVNTGTGEIRFTATLLDLGAKGTDAGTQVSDFSGEIVNPDLFAANQFYAGFRIDSSTTTPAFNRFSLVREQ